MKKILFISLILLVGIAFAQSQTDNTQLTKEMFEPVKASDDIDEDQTMQPDKSIISELTPLSSYEFFLSLLVLCFGFFALLLEVWLIQKNKIDQDNTVKFIVITLIITATLFLITAGYNNNQIAPAMGLLGTIAGYLLGKSKDKNSQ
jgi:hypothetical protein